MSKSKELPSLNKPPITEALLDIKVKLNNSITLSDLEKLHNKVKKRFPKKNVRKFLTSGFQIAPAINVLSSSGEDGYLFDSPIEKKIFQARLDGFTFNKLKPYDNWKNILNESKELWKLYASYAKPIKILRIALRYINRIEIPLPINDFKDYFKTIFEISKGLPQNVAHFFMKILIPKIEIDSVANITLTIDKPTNTNKLPFIFDIDVFKNSEYNINDKKIWNDFIMLRDFKNDIFFNSITDKTMELFK